jgi:DUF4097 and DUF4098 domain-containing protein YvlB
MSRLALTILMTTSLVVPAMAQMRDNRDPQLNCDEVTRERSRDRGVSCEVQETRLGPSGTLDISSHNGGISVKGWSQNTVLVRARVEARAESDAEARNIASQVRVETSGGRIEASGPDLDRLFRNNDNRQWSVSFEVFTPWNTDLKVGSHNGGINISDIRGHVDAQSHNGGVNLNRLAGDVAGETHNGGINVELAGNTWEGRQLELNTHNGGINLTMPGSYSASLETKTDHGRVNSDFPVNVRGRLDDSNLNFSVGSGGPLIKATTHNGGIHLKKM